MNKAVFLAGIVLISTLGCDNNRTTTVSPTTSSPSATANLPAMTDTDRVLAQKVQDTLRQDSAGASAAQHVQVHAKNGEITLSGSVSTQEEKASLENKAKQVSGVSSVNNQLTVTSASR